MDPDQVTSAAARARRRRNLLWVVPLLIVLVGALVVGTALLAGVAARSLAGTATPPTPSAVATSDPSAPPGSVDDAFTIDPLVGREPRIVLYVDYACSECSALDHALGHTIEEWIEDGSASLAVHPVVAVDGVDPAASRRGANAAACVGSLAPGTFYAFHTGLLEEPAATASADGLIALAASRAGATGADVAACIRDETWAGWVAAATERALGTDLPDADAPLVAVPTVLVDGRRYEGAATDPAAFAAFVADA